jgi:hypothetical protein
MIHSFESESLATLYQLPHFESTSLLIRGPVSGVHFTLLELVLGAFNRGESPEGIVRSYRTLVLADVYAVISRYLADPAPFDRYLQDREQESDAVRCQLDDAGVVSRIGKQELLRRVSAKELNS